MLSRRLVAATLALALTTPALALADPGTPAAPTEQARSHYKQGKAYQEAGAYDQAIAEYLEANRLAPRPELYFNIGQCHRLAGHIEEAVRYYHKFVDAMPAAAGADEARRWIAELELQLEKQRDQAKAKAEAAAPAPDLTPPPAAEPPDRGRPALRWVGIGGVVTGAALVGLGAYFGARAADEGDALSLVHGEWTAELDAREVAARTDEQRMWILVGGGSALVLGGACLWWLGGRHVETTPVVSRDSAALMLRGTF
jgi:tetratricopeptide (TPR) repeat protein